MPQPRHTGHDAPCELQRRQPILWPDPRQDQLTRDEKDRIANPECRVHIVELVTIQPEVLLHARRIGGFVIARVELL